MQNGFSIFEICDKNVLPILWYCTGRRCSREAAPTSGDVPGSDRYSAPRMPGGASALDGDADGPGAGAPGRGGLSRGGAPAVQAKGQRLVGRTPTKKAKNGVVLKFVGFFFCFCNCF